MEKLKKIILISIIVIVLVILLTVGIIYLKRGEVVYNIDEVGTADEELDEIKTELRNVSERNDYYAVKSCVDKFYIYYNELFENGEFNEEIEDVDVQGYNRDDYKNAMCNMLDKEYLLYKGINANNIDNKLEKINIAEVNINDMYVSQRTSNMYVYIVNGRLRDEETDEISDFLLMIKIDTLNRTFTVFLQDYINEKYEKISLGDTLDINVEENIQENDDNMYDYTIIDDETYVNDLLSKYKSEMLYDWETAYKHLDEEYREKRFGNINNFKEYSEKTIVKNVRMKLNKYNSYKYDDYVQWVCIDQYGNYYIFNEKSIMNYNMILDTYTIDLKQFTEKYNTATDQIKVGMNVEKILNAIKEDDYNYVYSKLDETYKRNNFSNINDFYNFIENTFYSENISYDQFKNLGGVYTYKLVIEGEEPKTTTIIMKLLDNLDYVISFEIN